MPNTKPTSRVAIIITAWNQVAITVECLASVASLDYPATEVIVVDNGSQPPIQSLLALQFPTVRFLRNDENLGFAGGYNTGLRTALAEGFDYFFLLNNDTVLEPSSLSLLVQALQADEAAGAVMPKIYYASDPTLIWSIGANYRFVLRELEGDFRGRPDTSYSRSPRSIEFAPFCAILFRREALETVGLLDEQFFLYYEDLDYCLRLMASGYGLKMIPAAHVWHKVSVSTGGWHSPLERYWIAQSSGRYFRRHGRGWRTVFIVPYRLGSALRLTLKLMWRQQWRSLRAYWLGLRYGWLGSDARTAPPDWVVDQ